MVYYVQWNLKDEQKADILLLSKILDKVLELFAGSAAYLGSGRSKCKIIFNSKYLFTGPQQFASFSLSETLNTANVTVNV